MTAFAGQLRFFADESVLGVGKALAIARRDTVHSGHPLIAGAYLGALDTEWIPVVARERLIVISRDRHIKTKPGELQLLRDSGLRVFWIAGKRDLSNWDYLVRLVRRWPDIERLIAERGDGPWFMAVNESTVSEISL